MARPNDKENCSAVKRAAITCSAGILAAIAMVCFTTGCASGHAHRGALFSDADVISAKKTTSQPPPAPSAPEPPRSSSTTTTTAPRAAKTTPETSQAQPVLKPGLLVSVTVLTSGKPEVKEEAKRIAADGTITLPLIGTVKVAGLELKKVSEKLRTHYRAYLRDPIVDISFAVDTESEGVFPWGYVTVLGRVKSPGRVGIPPSQDLSLSMAIQFAGSFDTSAKMTDIRIARESTTGKSKTFTINLQGVGANGDVDNDMMLKSGDVVFVPERIW